MTIKEAAYVTLQTYPCVEGFYRFHNEEGYIFIANDLVHSHPHCNPASYTHQLFNLKPGLTYYIERNRATLHDELVGPRFAIMTPVANVEIGPRINHVLYLVTLSHHKRGIKWETIKT